MFSEDLIEHIVSETNWFAQECIAAKPDTEWHGMTLEEMKAFLRVDLLFGIKQLPANHLYWSSDPLIGVLSVEKACQKIILTNCLSTFIWIPTQDKLCKKIQDITSCSKFAPFWIMLLKIVETLWPGRNLSVDEAMVKFKGHLGMKQYLPVKPVKRGIKVWVCAEASSGYVCDFQVYTWKKQHGMVEQNLGYRVVHDLMQNFVRTKFAPFWIMLLKIVETLWPGRNLSVDEAMVKFKGHLGMKQYLPVKPVKRGISVGLCRSVKWVCLWFPNVYLKETTWHDGTKSWISCCSRSNAELCQKKSSCFLRQFLFDCLMPSRSSKLLLK